MALRVGRVFSLTTHFPNSHSPLSLPLGCQSQGWAGPQSLEFTSPSAEGAYPSLHSLHAGWISCLALGLLVPFATLFLFVSVAAFSFLRGEQAVGNGSFLPPHCCVSVGWVFLFY